MRLTFGPDDEDAFYTARDQLVARFERSRSGRGLGWVASQILDFKWGYLDGDLAGWDQDDIVEILLGLYPAKVILVPEDVATVVRGFVVFLRFLGYEGLIADDHARRLAGSVERLEPDFRAAAFDERNWSTGKRLWSHAQSEGVDPEDSEALERFIEDFNARPYLERDAILGPPPGSHLSTLGSTLIGPLPPVVLPQADELKAAAGDTVVLKRLKVLVDYVGDGLVVTDRGNLKLADGETLVDLLETDDRFNPTFGYEVYKTRTTTRLPGLDLTYRLALATRMLVLVGKKVVPGPNRDWVDDAPEALYGVWLALLKSVGPTKYQYGKDAYTWGWFAEDLDEALPMILLDLYRDGEAPIEDITVAFCNHLERVYDLDAVPPEKMDFQRMLVEDSVRRAFDRLAELGTVAISDVVTKPTEYGGTERAGGMVGLMPLGKWVMQRFASAVTSAPAVGEFRDETALDLLRAVSDIAEELAAAEIDAWIGDRGEAGARELVEALPTSDETARGLAFRALLRIGPSAAEHLASLADHPELSPYVTISRVDLLEASADETDCTGDPERFVRLLAAVIELWGPESAVGEWVGPAAGADGIIAMLDQAWRVDLPDTETVLAAIGSEHSDPTVAKAARRALFKHRSSN